MITSSLVARSMELVSMIWPRNGMSVSRRSGAFASDRVSEEADPSPPYHARARMGASSRSSSGTRLIVFRSLDDPAGDQLLRRSAEEVCARRVGRMDQEVAEPGPAGDDTFVGWRVGWGHADELFVGAAGSQVEV